MAKGIMLDLFSPSGQIAQFFYRKGWQCVHVQRENWNKVDPSVFKKVDLIWLQPPCDCFSKASIYKHWGLDGTISNKVKSRLSLIAVGLEIIMITRPKFYYIENPTGMLNTIPIMKEIPSHYITQCQYGNSRQKPTRIWTNDLEWKPRPPCKRGAKCHEPAPRGCTRLSQGGMERAEIPELLLKEIYDSVIKRI